MARISELYQRSHDIDWFSKVGDIYIHAMSFGGLLPDAINDWNLLRRMLRKAYQTESLIKNSYVYNIPYIESRLSIQYENQRANNEQQDIIRVQYLRHFQEMAHRGFCSFDRDLQDENIYHLIVRPVIPMKEWDKIFNEVNWPNIELQKADDNSIIGFRIVREDNSN